MTYSAPSPYKVTTLQQNSLKNVTTKELVEANANGLKIMEKVTDPSTIQQMVKDGLAETDENGNLPTRIITDFAPDKIFESHLPELQSSLLRSSGISVTKTRYYDGQYFDDYDRYVVDGPAEFEVTYSKKGYSNWNTDLSGDVSVGGTVYGIAALKAAVSAKVGYSFGEEYEEEQRYSVDIPDGKYWRIKVWVSYLVYEYTGKVNNQTIGTGYTWKPNGLIIKKSEYNL